MILGMPVGTTKLRFQSVNVLTSVANPQDRFVHCVSYQYLLFASRFCIALTVED